MPPLDYGSAKVSSGPSSGSIGSSSSSSGLTNPFSMLEIRFNWGELANLHTAVEFAGARVGYGYNETTPYMTWIDNLGGDPYEVVFVDLAKAWDDGVITDRADLVAYADWDQTWDAYPGTPPDPEPGTGDVQLVAYYKAGSITLETTPGTQNPANTYFCPVVVFADGSIFLD